MNDSSVWKYCTVKQRRELLLSLELLERGVWPDDKHLACLYALSNHPERHYRKISVVKKDGTMRQLYEPDPLLKQVQRNILHHVLEEFSVSKYATAYRNGGGTKDNAYPHRNKDIILKMDMEKFFDHVMFYMVYQYAFPAVYFPTQIRTLLTNLCCYRECLPQGGPASAYISNLVLKSFDEHMGRWCEEREIIYTRYCDDITCSGSFHPQMVIRKISGYLQELGFYLNEKKTHVLTRSQNQMVTGITVNEKLQAPRAYRRELRKTLYYCEKYGVSAHLEHVKDTEYLQEEAAEIRRYLLSLLGKVNYVLYVNANDRFFREARVKVEGWLGS